MISVIIQYKMVIMNEVDLVELDQVGNSFSMMSSERVQNHYNYNYYNNNYNYI